MFIGGFNILTSCLSGDLNQNIDESLTLRFFDIADGNGGRRGSDADV